nr:pseudouridine synthase [Marinicella sp. W31]MDC2877163.1 pseudouridine synthase [Marinicella sp. W31]
MRIVKHGEPDADHAVSYYRVVDTAANTLSWLEMEPYTGRTHQLRVHALHIGHPIIGDPKYFDDDPNWEFPAAFKNGCIYMPATSMFPIPTAGGSR